MHTHILHVTVHQSPSQVPAAHASSEAYRKTTRHHTSGNSVATLCPRDIRRFRTYRDEIVLLLDTTFQLPKHTPLSTVNTLSIAPK